MKRIAVASCYSQHNYGSMIQAYATQMALDKLGYANETIDISGFHGEIKKAKMKYFVKASFTSDILVSKVGMAVNALAKKYSKSEYAAAMKLRDRKMDEFSRKYIRLSYQYRSIAELSEACAERYEAVLAGSDQLWLPGNIAADYFTLSFVPENVNSIAYATSFGQSTLPKDSEKRAARFLTKIRHIGVREEAGQKLVEKLTGRRVPIACDPTLLFTGEEWTGIQQKDALLREPYIFCYFLGNNPLHRQFAKRLKEKTRYRIVALVHLDEFVKSDEDYADITPYDIDPADFLNLIRNAAYVCTDSFHCSVFSMLYRRIFFVFRRYKRNTSLSTNNRLDTLLKLAGLKERILYGTEDIQECLNRRIDYDTVHKRLAAAREESYCYLEAALKDEKSTDLLL